MTYWTLPLWHIFNSRCSKPRHCTDCRLMFSIWAKQRPIRSISASVSSKFQSASVSGRFGWIIIWHRPGIDISVIVVLFLSLDRTFHCSRPHFGKFQHYVIQQLIVCQWACQIYYHVAEYLVVGVAVQLFHQFRATESRVHVSISYQTSSTLTAPRSLILILLFF